MSWPIAVLAAYFVVLGCLSLNGLHRLWMVWAYARRARIRPIPAPPVSWPRVTVQLPIYNEQHVVTRLIEACGRLEYPVDRLEIQVLDDSTDMTTERARAAVGALVARGIDASLVRRADRKGFKAGALDHGLSLAKADLVAIFDADFLPSPDFLKRCVPSLLDDDVGMVQARWGHLNEQASWLTGAQATLLDGHFVVEHSARHMSGRWFNFNGTAGIWKRQAITDAGGWQHDTLTEDLDLSYRCQLAGWSFVYRPDVVAPAELPPDMVAFKTQQHRWARGSIQTARKLVGRIWRSQQPFSIKFEATQHLLANLSYPLVVALSVLLPTAVLARIVAGPTLRHVLGFDVLFFGTALLPFLLFYATAVVGSGAPGAVRRLAALPLALALGLGLAVAQSKAVWEGFFGPVGEFVRTPKWGESAFSTYARGQPALVVVEIGLALYIGVASVVAGAFGLWGPLPFLGLFGFGYGSVAWLSLTRAPIHQPMAATGHVTHHSQSGSAQPVPASDRVKRTA